VSDDPESPEGTVKGIVLNASDRELVWMAARLLIAQEPGQERMNAVEQLVQHYRDDLADAYHATDSEALDEMAVNFTGALLLKMEQLQNDEDGDEATLAGGTRRFARPRLTAALGLLLEAVDPRN
jgi:hypothetical protein